MSSGDPSAAFEGERPEWHGHAACRGLTGLFFSTRKTDVAHAKEICRGDCPVRSQCDLESVALETAANGIFGVRAGYSQDERKHRLRQRRRRSAGVHA